MYAKTICCGFSRYNSARVHKSLWSYAPHKEEMERKFKKEKALKKELLRDCQLYYTRYPDVEMTDRERRDHYARRGARRPNHKVYVIELKK